MTRFVEFSEKIPQRDLAVILRVQELSISIIAYYNDIQNLFVTETLAIIKPFENLEWKYASCQDVALCDGFKPMTK